MLAPIKGSPADRAGIRPGDILLTINGEDTAGWTGEMAARHLRGQGGTQVCARLLGKGGVLTGDSRCCYCCAKAAPAAAHSLCTRFQPAWLQAAPSHWQALPPPLHLRSQVRVRLVRHTDQIPGVAGRPPRPVEPATREMEVSMTRETVALSPLFYTDLPGPAGERVGYLRLAAFSQNAGQAVRDAITELEVGGGWCRGGSAGRLYALFGQAVRAVSGGKGVCGGS